MTIGELKELIKDVPNDFAFEVDVNYTKLINMKNGIRYRNI